MGADIDATWKNTYWGLFWRYKRRLAWSEAFCETIHIIFALKYNKQQLLLLLDKINSTSKILGDITMDVPPS